jgi:hypothetical protein
MSAMSILSSTSRRLALIPLLLWCACAAQATGLPDSGQSQCDNGSNVMAVCSNLNTGDAATYPRQDGRFGRDAKATASTLSKTGGGAAGFDYSKIANNGSDLGAGAGLLPGTNPTDWACTRDNITGLTWEVKTAGTADVRYAGHLYMWYSTNSLTNGGAVGGVGINSCNSTLPSNLCNTQAFITAVNTSPGLCNATDWRLPTLREILSIVNAGALSPSIDTNYFPDTPSSNAYYWSNSSDAETPLKAWLVEFVTGSAYSNQKSTSLRLIRLVRGTPF